MTPDERQLLTRFLQDLDHARGVPKDQEADGMIRQTLSANPDAGYWLVQHAIVADQSLLPRAAAPLSDVEQIVVLRHAIALAMLGRMSDLGSLHQRYAAGFEAKPSGRVFGLLSGPLNSGGGTRLEEALAALPTVSPVDALAPLLDAPVTPVEPERTTT